MRSGVLVATTTKRQAMTGGGDAQTRGQSTESAQFARYAFQTRKPASAGGALLPRANLKS